MFSSIIVNSQPVLPETNLIGLGRLNVICGRNNSGKSTLLAAIVDEKNCAPGFELNSEIQSKMHAELVPHISYLKNTDHPYTQHHRREFDAAAKITPVITQKNIAIFMQNLQNNFASNITLRNVGFPQKAVEAALRKHLKGSPKSILIPAKRNLELFSNLQGGDNVKPTGAGILKLLFSYKNQPRSSAQHKLYSKIVDAFKTISGGYEFDVHVEHNNPNQINLSFIGPGAENYVPALASGLGLQDILILVFFAIEETSTVVCIEEPESHIHPDMQRRLLMFLKSQQQKQFIFTTHSNIFLDTFLIDRVFFTKFDKTISVSDQTSRATMLDDLGYSVADNLVSDLVILVEGPTDTPIIEYFLHKLGLMQRFDIKIWPLGGDVMN